MKRMIISVIAVSTLSAALIGCGFRTAEAYDEKGDIVSNTRVSHYDGRVVTDRDLVIYRKDPRHVYVYDGVRYRVKSHQNRYVYYRI